MTGHVQLLLEIGQIKHFVVFGSATIVTSPFRIGVFALILPFKRPHGVGLLDRTGNQWIIVDLVRGKVCLAVLLFVLEIRSTVGHDTLATVELVRGTGVIGLDEPCHGSVGNGDQSQQ